MMGADLADRTREELRTWATDRGAPAYRGDQVFEWIHMHGASSFAEMSNLPRDLREELGAGAVLGRPEIVRRATSNDGTTKLLCAIGEDRARVEVVVIPEGARRTVCISTQVGCSLSCTFCMTGKSGFDRNLTAGEIVGQHWAASHRAGPEAEPPTNVVLMGMGEPLANAEETIRALEILTDDRGMAVPPSRITLSTAGYRPELIEEILSACRVNLAISLHAATDELRAELLPHDRKWPIDRLLEAVRDVLPLVRDRVTLEYVLLAGVNDRPADVRALADLCTAFPAPVKVNLIPWNPHEGGGYERPSSADVERVRASLVEAGVDAYVRRPRGDDIDAACGQLRIREERERAGAGC